MNIVIIAAGKGSRIYKKVKINKQLIKINNNILLVKLVENAIKSGFKKIFVVVGFRPNNIKKALKKFKNITFVNNNFYKSREMLFSIICGLKASKEDTIISYSDIIYDHNLLNLIKKSKSKYISLPVNLNWKKIWKIRKKNIYEDAETLKYDKNLKLTDIGKKLKKTNIPKSQFMGLIYIPKKKINRIIKYYHKNNLKKMQTTDFLNYLISKKEIIKVHPNRSFWYEFDDYEDLYNFRKKFN